MFRYYLNRLGRLLSSLPITIYFNFHYLPFRQAVKLPIWLRKAELKNMKGKIIIDCDNIKSGMITLGFRDVSIYPNTGIMWENKGGTVVFKGECNVGNASYLSFGKNATVEFGNKFCCNAAFKLVSFRNVRFGESVSFGWDVIVMDTNFHPLYDMKQEKFKKASGPITIGDYNWFGTGCKIMHDVNTPERCIFGMGCIITRNSEMKSYCLMGGSPVKILTENVMRDFAHDEDE